MIDTRTEAEKAYDSLKDGSAYIKTPADQGPFGTDVTDEFIALLEEMEEHEDARLMINVSPSLESDQLLHVPQLLLQDNLPMIRLGGSTDAELAHLLAAAPERASCLLPRRVHEIVRLDRRGLVLIDAEDEIFVMTAAEFAAQTGDEAKRDNARGQTGRPPAQRSPVRCDD